MGSLNRYEGSRCPEKLQREAEILVKQGYLLGLLSLVVLVFGTYAMVLSPALAELEIPPVCPLLVSLSFCSNALRTFLQLEIHRTIAADTHYKHFPFLMVPAGLLFVIANWVGWQYYQNS